MAHTHPLPDLNHDNQRLIAIAFWLNTVFVVVEVVGGIWVDSIAIIADALHDFMDSLGLGLAWFLTRIASKRPDATYTYGYQRFTLVSALLTGCLIMVGQLLVILEAVPRLWQPGEPFGPGMMILALLGMAVNGIGAYVLSKGSGVQSRLLTWHLLEDVLGWAAVLLAALLIIWQGWHWADPVLAVGIAVYVSFSAFRHLKKALFILLQSVPEGFDQQAFVADLHQLDGVQDSHDLHIWSLDGDHHILSVHLVLQEAVHAEQRQQIRQAVETLANRYGSPVHTTVEMEDATFPCPHADDQLYMQRADD